MTWYCGVGLGDDPLEPSPVCRVPKRRTTSATSHLVSSRWRVAVQTAKSKRAVIGDRSNDKEDGADRRRSPPGWLAVSRLPGRLVRPNAPSWCAVSGPAAEALRGSAALPEPGSVVAAPVVAPHAACAGLFALRAGGAGVREFVLPGQHRKAVTGWDRPEPGR